MAHKYADGSEWKDDGHRSGGRPYPAEQGWKESNTAAWGNEDEWNVGGAGRARGSEGRYGGRSDDRYADRGGGYRRDDDRRPRRDNAGVDDWGTSDWGTGANRAPRDEWAGNTRAAGGWSNDRGGRGGDRGGERGGSSAWGNDRNTGAATAGWEADQGADWGNNADRRGTSRGAGAGGWDNHQAAGGGDWKDVDQGGAGGGWGNDRGSYNTDRRGGYGNDRQTGGGGGYGNYNRGGRYDQDRDSGFGNGRGAGGRRGGDGDWGHTQGGGDWNAGGGDGGYRRFDDRDGGRPPRDEEDLWGNQEEQVWDDRAHNLFVDGYVEHPTVAALPESEIEKYRSENKIEVRDERCPRPIMMFELSPFGEEINSWLMGRFPAPTPVQAQGWPIALKGYSMIARAVTGSGKTLAFVLPALVHCRMRLERGDTLNSGEPMCLIVSPTREVATQIFDMAKVPADIVNIKTYKVVGGENYRVRDQMMELYQNGAGHHMVVGTPGRLGDLMKRGCLSLRSCSFWVIDEADEMLQKGFIMPIRAINRMIPPSRQVLMCSATWPPQVKDLADEVFNTGSRNQRPILLKIGVNETQMVNSITYEFEYCGTDRDYDDKLIDRLQRFVDQRVVVFCNTKRDCEYVINMVNKRLPTHRAESIHGDKTNTQRESTLRAFREGTTNVIVASDVLARGIDVKNVAEVILYELPNDYNTFVHRTGRTGRAGATGNSFSLVGYKDGPMMQTIGNLLRNNNCEMASYNRCMAALGCPVQVTAGAPDEGPSNDHGGANNWNEQPAGNAGWNESGNAGWNEAPAESGGWNAAPAESGWQNEPAAANEGWKEDSPDGWAQKPASNGAGSNKSWKEDKPLGSNDWSKKRNDEWNETTDNPETADGGWGQEEGAWPVQPGEDEANYAPAI